MKESHDTIANRLAGRAADESLEIEAYQNEEWRTSVNLLQATLDERIPVLREALSGGECEFVRHVILEFDFHRRGLRMDCLLLAEGVLFVVEFKKTKVQRADRDQVMSYAVNLLEFHRHTQEICGTQDGAVIVPVIALTSGKIPLNPEWPGLRGLNWSSLAKKPLECDGSNLKHALLLGRSHRRSASSIDIDTWLSSPFRPSSSILDATLSLYGNHDVAAIEAHAVPKEEIAKSVTEIRSCIEQHLQAGSYHVIFLSGAPGAGKTLVGLDIVMRGTTSDKSVFVTGNAPLVDVLTKALAESYRSQSNAAETWTPTGYRRKDAGLVISAANYKIVKAHSFLGKRGEVHRQEDGRILVFDEAQRTYEKGRLVMREKLPDHEADLILDVQKKAFPQGGAIVLALVGHNQAINNGEMGIMAWLGAIERKGWTFSISDETLSLSEFDEREKWASHKSRRSLANGHLHQSMRYYRNARVEEWVSAVLDNDRPLADSIAQSMRAEGDSIWITRRLDVAKNWARKSMVGGKRAGLIASGQAKRLAAEGLFVDYKPKIAPWMLAPTSDIRSSNALETVQNQYQIQGLELDYSIVCWDSDLRYEASSWAAYKLSGSDWKRDRFITVAKNGYRVLLTRARKGMMLFVPTGDLSGDDSTRKIEFFDGTFDFLKKCGAQEWES